MKTENSEVKHKGVIVATIEVPVYDTLDEIIAAHDEATIVDMFNKQYKIALQAKARNKFTEARTSKKAMRIKAFNLLTNEELARFAGDFVALEAFLESQEMMKRLEAAESSGL